MAIVKKVYKMEDLDCANCALKMQDAVCRLEGVENCEINFMMQKMTIEADDDKFDDVMKKAVECIKKVEPDCTVVLKWAGSRKNC